MLQHLSNAVQRNPFIGITCDIWQDKYRRISYLGVTAHFLNDDSNLCDQLIALQALDWRQKKDANFIRLTIKKVLEDKNVPCDPHKIVFIADRGGNIKKALRDFSRINCFPHFLNNVAKEACKIDLIKTIITACADLVRYIKISGHYNEFKRSLKSPVSTRFHSILVMIDMIVENWDQLVELMDRENESVRLEDIDIAVLRQMQSFLKPFKHWSDFAETSKKFRPIYCMDCN